MRSQKLLIVILVLVSNTVLAQNARFSQLGSAPLQFNPALSGRFDGKFRGGALMSFQQTENADVPHTAVFLDYKFGKFRYLGDEELVVPGLIDSTGKRVKKEAKDETEERRNSGFWSAGVNYYRYGDNNDKLTGEFFSGTIARHFYNKRNKFWGVGFQATYAKGALNENRIDPYDKEISGGSFTYPKRLSSTGNRISSKTYTDFNVGAYYGLITEQVSLELGLSMYHLFYPQNDVLSLDDETKLRHRVTAHTALRIKLNDKFGIVQKNMYWGEGLYYKSRRLNGDSLLIESVFVGMEFYKTEPLSRYNLNFGLYTRSFRTVMPYANLSLGLIANLRFSYEFPINPERFNAYTAKRTEVALILTHKKNTPTGTRFYKKFNYW